MKTYCIVLIILGLAFPLVHATTTHVLQSDQTFEGELSTPGMQIPDGTEYMPEETIDSLDDSDRGLVLVELVSGVRDAVDLICPTTA